MSRNSKIVAFIFGTLSILITPEITYSQSHWPQFMHNSRNTGRTTEALPDQPVIKWSSDFGSYVEGLSLNANGDTIYACSIDHYLYAVKTSNGAVKWRYAAENELVGSPAIDSAGNIYFGAKDNYLYCLTPEGVLNWRAPLDDDALTSPVITSANALLISTRTNFYAFSLNGTLQWELEHRTYNSTPAVGTDGTIYHNTSDGNPYPYGLYALNPDGSENGLILNKVLAVDR